ncbi:MAG: PhzF family phenazine biosynthesis protein [Dehalococcoidia bacterium]|nr:MAG: PhzF family phenazine biosynthesis protein [Dehalococcoidia bacterium]
MTRSVAFRQVDVFTSVPFFGNPVAVILDGSRLSTEEMQRVARWTNLSETTFVLPSERADYRLRIFTPLNELPFAGHPTVGSAHAVIEAGLVTPRAGGLTQECVAGIIALRAEPDGRVFARAPKPTVRRVDVDLVLLSAAIGAPVEREPAPALVDVGPVWLITQVASFKSLAEATPDLAAVSMMSAKAGAIGISAFAINAQTDAAERVWIRTWAPGAGVPEDPACGSCNAALGAYLGASGLLPRTGRSYIASQGRELGRDARIAVTVHGPEEVDIGGHAVTVVEGAIRLD